MPILERKCILCPYQTVYEWWSETQDRKTFVGCADNFGNMTRGSCVIPYGFYLNPQYEALNAH